MNEIQKLLRDVGEKIEKAEEISRLKGENFNIFSILGVETKENKTHSNFLVSLLNPKGKHGLGNVFSNLFYDELENIGLTEDKLEILGRIRVAKINVRAEESLGKVNLEEYTGGRVDITLRSIEGNIFIENKIYAGDQCLQIARYCENHNSEKNIVLYLTLNGKSPSKSSSGEKFKAGTAFFLLSYQTNIINWLEKCQKEASDFPIIRETIKQYIILIKKLTGQLTSQEMEKEIIEIIKKDLKNAFAISNNINNAKIEIVEDTLKRLEEQLKNKLDDNWEFIRKNKSNGTWPTFSIKLKSTEEGRISLQGYSSFLTGKRRLGITGLESKLEKIDDLQGFKKNTGAWTLYKEHNFGDSEFINYSEEYVNRITEDFIKLASILESLQDKY